MMVSCSSDDDDDPNKGKTIAQIMTLDPEGKTIPDVNIRLVCETSTERPCEIDIRGKSNSAGMFEKEFVLPKVLRVNAHKIVLDTVITGVPPNTQTDIVRDSICGQTYISIVEGTTSRQTVVLFSCED